MTRAAVFLLLFLAAVCSAQSPPLRVLVITGGHTYHPSFAGLFENQPGLQVMMNGHPRALRRNLSQQYDVLVFYDRVDDLPAEERDHLRVFVESKKGVVVMHHAVGNYQAWPWWYREVVGGRYIYRAEGSTPASTYQHGQKLTVRPVERHPVTAGVGELNMIDETYKGQWISPDVKVLMTTDHPDNDRAVVWAGPCRTSRVIYIQLGHGPEAHAHAGFRRLVRNTILWTGGRQEAQ